MPVVRVGRIAGQYAKPRSSPIEKIKNDDGSVREVPSFRSEDRTVYIFSLVSNDSAEFGLTRGDNVNGQALSTTEAAGINLFYIIYQTLCRRTYPRSRETAQRVFLLHYDP